MTAYLFGELQARDTSSAFAEGFPLRLDRRRRIGARPRVADWDRLDLWKTMNFSGLILIIEPF
jgi:hypothetical protein